MTFKVGSHVGDYELLGELGQGGMGHVYRVRNVVSNRIEAMKAISPDVAVDPEIGERFLCEIRTLALLHHPHIAQFYTAFEYDGQLVMLMEYVDGSTLGRLRTPLSEMVGYVQQILSALSYAHEHGVVHRDIKPSNVMVTGVGVAKLMDFGIARSEAVFVKTQTGSTVGSLSYMSPEQLRGEQVDARSDIYSVGVLLYELSTGRPPYEFGAALARLEPGCRKPIELNPSIPVHLSEAIMTALSPDPADRFQSAEEFRVALENQTVTMPARRPRRVPSRTLWMAAGAIACCCALIVLSTVLPYRNTAAAPSTSSSATKVERKMTPPAIGSAPKPVAQAKDEAQQPALSRKPIHSRAGSPSESAAIVSAQSTQPAANDQGEANIDQLRDELVSLQGRANSCFMNLANLRNEVGQLHADVDSAAARLDADLKHASRDLESHSAGAARTNIERAKQTLNDLGKVCPQS